VPHSEPIHKRNTFQVQSTIFYCKEDELTKCVLMEAKAGGEGADGVETRREISEFGVVGLEFLHALA
jgi:hypothetical protein